MYEYIRWLCACGMRIDDAYTVVNDFYRELDFDGLLDFIKGYEIAQKIVRENVD